MFRVMNESTGDFPTKSVQNSCKFLNLEAAQWIWTTWDEMLNVTRVKFAAKDYLLSKIKSRSKVEVHLSKDQAMFTISSNSCSIFVPNDVSRT